MPPGPSLAGARPFLAVAFTELAAAQERAGDGAATSGWQAVSHAAP